MLLNIIDELRSDYDKKRTIIGDLNSLLLYIDSPPASGAILINNDYNIYNLLRSISSFCAYLYCFVKFVVLYKIQYPDYAIWDDNQYKNFIDIHVTQFNIVKEILEKIIRTRNLKINHKLTTINIVS